MHDGCRCDPPWHVRRATMRAVALGRSERWRAAAPAPGGPGESGCLRVPRTEVDVASNLETGLHAAQARRGASRGIPPSIRVAAKWTLSRWRKRLALRDGGWLTARSFAGSLFFLEAKHGDDILRRLLR